MKITAKHPMYEYLSKLRTMDGFGEAEIRQYLRDHWLRFMTTLEYLKRYCPPGAQILEIGSSPYLMTTLIEKELSCKIETSNYYGPQHPAEDEHCYKSSMSGETLRWRSRHFDAESDAYPYDEFAFDCVVACEILEHFSKHPAWMLMEAHRVLKPGGHLILTTPNAIRADVLLDVLKGVNPHDAYSGYGPGGRHNREYTLDELKQWLSASGFVPVCAEQRDAYPHNWLLKLVSASFPSRQDNLFVVARKDSDVPFRMERPAFLYRGEPFLTKVQHSIVMFGTDDSTQLGDGWYGAENAYGRPGRWTSAKARIFLRNVPGVNAIRLEFFGGNGDGATTLNISDYQQQQFTHRPNEWNSVEIKLKHQFDNPNFFIDINAPTFHVRGDTRSLGHYFVQIAAVINS